jgi:hypothetical protein
MMTATLTPIQHQVVKWLVMDSHEMVEIVSTLGRPGMTWVVRIIAGRNAVSDVAVIRDVSGGACASDLNC